jgi:hypothetical protein
MNCAKCGKDLSSTDALFCPYCGSKIKNPQYQGNFKPKKKSGIVPWIAAIAIIAAAVFGVASFLKKYPLSTLLNKDVLAEAGPEIPEEANALEMHRYLQGYVENEYQASDSSKAFWNNVNYSVNSIEYADDTSGVANITLTRPDVSSLTEEIFAYCLAEENAEKTEQEMRADLDKLIVSSASNSKVTEEIEMGVVKESGNWKLVPNEEWERALIGEADNIFSQYFQQFLDSVVEQVSDSDLVS